MTLLKKTIVLITGASSGIGAAVRRHSQRRARI